MLFLSFLADCSFFISHLLEQIAATLEIPLVAYQVPDAGILSLRFCMFYTHFHSRKGRRVKVRFIIIADPRSQSAEDKKQLAKKRQ